MNVIFFKNSEVNVLLEFFSTQQLFSNCNYALLYHGIVHMYNFVCSVWGITNFYFCKLYNGVKMDVPSVQIQQINKNIIRRMRNILAEVLCSYIIVTLRSNT